jgi:protein dithiol oxidoreductase (disulfide-forming)
VNVNISSIKQGGIKQSLMAALLLLMSGFLSVNALAAEPVEGKDYRRIQPAQATDSPGKIEVVEFFSYACPHCAQFNPQLMQWAEKLPPGVVFKRVPVLFNRAPWGNLARLYYALEVTGDLPALDQAVFTAMHKEGENLADPRALNEWLVKKNVNIQKFNDAYNAFGVRGRINRGDQMTKGYAIDGVPALAINGMYLINSELSHDQQLRIAEALIAKLRTPVPAAKSGK